MVVSSKTVQKASKSLLQWRNSKQQTEKPQLLDEEDFFYLVVTLKEIPTTGRTNPYKIPLPHSLHSESSELCLFFDDRTRSGLTKDAVKKKIQSENIPVSKIIGLSKLKSDYRPFEAKRKLCDSYDLFFADDRVIPLLPSLLGKHFFKKKKIPVPLNLRHKNWKEQIMKNCSSALLYLRTGTCCVVKVAKASMEIEEIVSDVLAAIDGIIKIVPKELSNVRSFHLKLLESVSLPMYQSVPEMKLREDKGMGDGACKIHVKANGSGKEAKEKKVSKKKGRIHEVCYMDNNIDELFDNDEIDSDLDEVIENIKVNVDATMGSDEMKGKKRNRLEKVKEEIGSELNVEKRSKKSSSVKGKESVKQNRLEEVKEEIVVSELNVEKESKKSSSAKNKESFKRKKDEISGKKKNEEKIKKKKLTVEDVEDGESPGNNKNEAKIKKKKLTVENGKSPGNNKNEDKIKKKKSMLTVEDGESLGKNKNEDRIKKKKNTLLTVDDGESPEKKENKSGVKKLKNGGTKVKTKKLKTEN